MALLEDPTQDEVRKRQFAAAKAFFKAKAEAEKAAAQAEPEPEPEPAAQDAAQVEKTPAEKVVLSDPKWESDLIHWHEEATVSVAVELPEALKAQKLVLFTLFARTPKGDEKIQQFQGWAKEGRAQCVVDLFRPKATGPNGKLLEEVDYFFTAKHSKSDEVTSPDKHATAPNPFIQSALVDGVTFIKNQSFIRPEQVGELKYIEWVFDDWAKTHPEGKIAIYGHADKSGEEFPNKQLSERRAKSTFSFITDDPDGWEELYNVENWGTSVVQDLLNDQDPDAVKGYHCGTVDGVHGKNTKAGLKKFQQDNGVSPSEGQNDKATRRALFLAYMTKSHDVKLTADRFFPIDGQPFMGCGELNPLIADPKENERNRRITFVLLKDSKKFPVLFPCKHNNLKPCNAQTALDKDVRNRPSIACKFYDKMVQVEEQPKPGQEAGAAPQLLIEKLDKWFIPGPKDKGGENCRLGWKIEGAAGKAESLELEVYGSGYCDASVKPDGKHEFTPLKDPVPLFTHAFGTGDTKPGASHKFEDWCGEAKPESGALKPGKGERYINAAFSPYTVLLRLFRRKEDHVAALRLKPFWPVFDKSGTLDATSLEIQWEVENCDKLKKGKLVIVDKSDTPVFETELAAEQLNTGAHKFTWDGKHTDGSAAALANMPYRVQVNACCADEEPEPLALAVMHTEVRLFAHPEGEKTGDVEKDPVSLEFGLGKYAEKAPDEKEQNLWYQYQLAEAGYHPGRLDGTLDAETGMAISELQRSVPANASKPFKRLNITGTPNAATTATLKGLKPDARPLFGDPATRTDIPRKDAAAKLKDPKQSVIAWVDDRHGYTEAGAGDFFMGDYRGDMSIGDDKVKKDADSICRPMLPLEVDIPLMSREDGGKGLESTVAKVNEATRLAIGPIRLDFSGLDAPYDVTPVDSSHANYDKKFTRSRKWTEETVKGWQKAEGGIDWCNAPEKIGAADSGGLRPADLKDYQKRLFSLEALSPTAWRAVEDKKTKTVCLRVHQDLGQDEKELEPSRVGKGGVFFRPSRIAGDGYRLKAAVSFAEEPAELGKLPNREVLARRYPRLPLGHSGVLRLWRKGSLRGHSSWCKASDAHWPAFAAPMQELYHAAHMHYVHEGPKSTQPNTIAVNTLVGKKDYKKFIQKHVTDAAYKKLKITFDAEKIWPYTKEKRLGLPQGKKGTPIPIFRSTVVEHAIQHVWRQYRKTLLHHLMQQVEKELGFFRGAFLVEFTASQNVDVVEYKCDTCGNIRTEITNNCKKKDLLEGKKCKDGGCKGKFNVSTQETWANLPLPAVGVSMSGTWLFTSGNPSVWAHELGHIRHLQHAPPWPGKAKTAPGAQAQQHDSQLNPEPSLVGQPNKDRGWDRECIMGYNHGDLYFCGKCLMKVRGVAVEGIANPAGGVKD